MLKILLYVALATAFVAIGLFLSSDVNRVVLLSPSGKTEQTGILGISIGDPIESARYQLERRGFKRYEDSTPGHCLGERLGNREAAEDYFHTTWKDGTICVFYIGGKVSKLKWDFVVMPL